MADGLLNTDRIDDDMTTVADRGDRLGVFPSRVDVRAMPERRYLWTARAFAIIATILTCLNVVLVLTLYQLLPGVRVDPYFVTYNNNSDQVVEIEPVSIRMSAAERMAEQMVRYYVTQRHEIISDFEEMTRRWAGSGPINAMSNRRIYANFRSEIEPMIEMMEANQLTQTIEILRASTLGDNRLWQVDFRRRRRLEGASGEEDVSVWRAVLRVAFQDRELSEQNRLINPLGFTVLSYSLDKIRDENEDTGT